MWSEQTRSFDMRPAAAEAKTILAKRRYYSFDRTSLSLVFILRVFVQVRRDRLKGQLGTVSKIAWGLGRK